MPEDKDIKPPLAGDGEAVQNPTDRRGWLPKWLRRSKSRTLPVVKIPAPNAFHVEAEIPPRTPRSRAGIARVILYSGAYFEVVLIGCLIVFLCIGEMRHHFVNLTWRSWNAFVNSQGSTTLGWISSTIVVPVLAVVAMVFLIRQRRGRKAMLSHWRQDAAVALQVIGFVVLFYYGPLFIWKGFIRTVYDDHQTLVSAVQDVQRSGNGSIAVIEKRSEELEKQNRDLAQQLEKKRHTIDTTDPVFPNIIYLLQAFNGYRHARNGDPCVLRITAPPESAAMASMVAQFSNSVSGCFTFGPDTGMSPDLDEIESKGMIQGKILIHTEKDDIATNQLQMNLGNYIQTAITNKPIPAEIRNFALPPAGTQNKKVWIAWLQFGPNVVWNSELTQRQK